VLRRDIKFDPQIDPIVRVEATRLRRAIERYYAGSGMGDPVIIDLPRGSYIPTFRFREIPSVRAVDAANSFGRFGAIVRARPIAVAVAGAMLIVIVAVAGLALHQQTRSSAGVQGPGREPPIPTDLAALPPGNGMPTIYIAPFRVSGKPMAQSVTATSLFEKIKDAFARFDTINVVVEPGQQTQALDGVASSTATPSADYRLLGTLEYGDARTNAQFQLVDSAEGKIVWSHSFGQVSTTDNGIADDGIVVMLANALLQSYGAIRARDRARHLASNTGDPRYRCILEAADAVRSQDPNERDRARVCLERLTMLDPSFAVGFAFLAITYNREFQQEYGERTRDPLALDKALKSARRAIELQPEDSRAYLALFVVQFNRGDLASAFAAAEKTIALNKYDMLALGEYGGRLILTGQIDKGMALMQRSGEYGAIRPSWHYFYLFMGNYLRGDMAEAIKNADHITTDNYAMGLVAKTIAARNEPERARQTIDRLLVLAPAWRTDPRGELARVIPDSGIIDRLMADLTAAGLQTRR
jgi:TolB-like protein